jgi:peptidoglycan hydrolase-like protein with peptidoglycan-binding domain
MARRGYNLTADGKFGAQTEHVVKVFQSRVGFRESGRIGPGIWRLAWEAPAGVGT